MAKPNVIFIGGKGTVLALDRATGQELWRTELKGMDFVNLVLDGENLYATAHGEIFCLDPVSGQLRWHNPLKGLGYGLIAIAASGVSSVLPMAESRRRQQAATTAASYS